MTVGAFFFLKFERLRPLSRYCFRVTSRAADCILPTAGNNHGGKLEKYCTVENEHGPIESRTAERQRSRVKGSDETESGEESENVGKRDDAMQLRWNVCEEGEVTSEEGHDVERAVPLRGGFWRAERRHIKDTMSDVVMLAKDIDESHDVGQPTAECQLVAR